MASGVPLVLYIRAFLEFGFALRHMQSIEKTDALKVVSMTCRIERLASCNSKVVLRLCGRIQVEHVGAIEELIRTEYYGVILDLMEVMLVDRDVVTFLAACERKGVELRNCPAFLQEWIAKV